MWNLQQVEARLGSLQEREIPDQSLVHAASRADRMQWNVCVRVSSSLSRSCSRHKAPSFWCKTQGSMAVIEKMLEAMANVIKSQTLKT